MSKSQKIDPATGEEFVPGHSRIEKKLDGIAAGVRTLAKKLDDRAREHDVQTHQSTVEARRQELAPYLDQARRAIDEMAVVEQELRPAVTAVLSLNTDSLRRVLRGVAWNRLVSVQREARDIEQLFRFTPETLRRLLRIAKDLSPGEAGASWRGIKAEFIEVIPQQASHPTDIRHRVELLQAALAQVMRDIEKAEAASPASVERPSNAPAQESSTKDFSPFERVSIDDNGEEVRS